MQQRLIEKVCSDDTLEKAFQWVQKRRANYSHNSDIWDLRWRWKAVKQELQVEMLAGRYHLSPLKEYRFPDGNRAVWIAQDALVLKALAIVLEPFVKIQTAKECTHLAWHGGSKSAVQEISGQLQNYSYFIRTDVRSYYASIEHDLCWSSFSACRFRGIDDSHKNRRLSVYSINICVTTSNSGVSTGTTIAEYVSGALYRR